MQEKIFNMLFEEDEVTWQSIIHELIKTEQMDPWDINISLLAKRFFEMIKKLKEMDFRVSGKILLAAAVLLRIKSHRLVGEDLDEFDRLISSSDQTEEDFYGELEAEYLGMQKPGAGEKDFQLIPRTPQPRQRKVSVYDLVDALNKALEVKNRRVGRYIPEAPKVEVPEKTRDISLVIMDIYKQIVDFFKDKQKLTFSQLVPSKDKEDMVYTFVPLLHLDNQRRIDISQKMHFGEIEIALNEKKAG